MPKKLLEAGIDVLPARTESGQIQIDGALSVLMHNAGTTDVTINGHLTLKAGATHHLAMPHPGVVINDYLTVVFSSTVGARLEIAMIRLKGEAYSNYS